MANKFKIPSSNFSINLKNPRILRVQFEYLNFTIGAYFGFRALNVVLN